MKEQRVISAAAPQGRRNQPTRFKKMLMNPIGADEVNQIALSIMKSLQAEYNPRYMRAYWSVQVYHPTRGGS
jgi:hypothetical protein